MSRCRIGRVSDVVAVGTEIDGAVDTMAVGSEVPAPHAATRVAVIRAPTPTTRSGNFIVGRSWNFHIVSMTS